jgi:hypothetical protein
MLARTQVMTVGSAKVRTLDRADFILHLCAHLYKEATTIPWIRMKRDMTLYKYCDIYALFCDFTKEEFNQLFKRVQTTQMEKEFLYCLDSIESLFGFSCNMLFEELYLHTDFDLAEVIAPTEKKLYRYIEQDVKKRFFTKDRMSLLEGADHE